MSPRLRYLLVSAARTRTALAPVAGSLFALFGVFAYRGNEVGETWGLTAVLCCALAAWLVGAVLAAEPAAQADMATVALGGRRGRAGLELVLVATVAASLTVTFIGFPLAVSPLGSAPMFVPPPRAGDVVAAALAHLSCAALGGAIAVLFAPPRLVRPATIGAATLAALLGLIPLAALGGPVAVARELADTPRGTIGAGELVACLSCLVLGALVLAGAARWARRAG